MKKIGRFYNLSREFGLSNAAMLSVYNLTRNDEKYIKRSCSILYPSLKDRIDRIQEEEATPIRCPVVWSFWWQGIEALPEILKVSYYSHIDHIVKQGIEYRFIDKNNINQYLTIPEHIQKKVDLGLISLTHFSDYIRIALLEKFGGAWIDITLLMVNDFPGEVFNYPLYSLNLNNSDHSPTGIGQKITQCKWAGFMFSSNVTHNPLLVYIKSALEEYWTYHDSVIDYFLMNLIIRTAYEYNTYARRLVDSIPVNNVHLYDLAEVINKPYENDYICAMEKDEVFFKVTQKVAMRDMADGKPTVYAHYRSMFLV